MQIVSYVYASLLQKSDSGACPSLKPNKNSANHTHPNQTRKMAILVQLAGDTSNHPSLSIKPNTPTTGTISSAVIMFIYLATRIVYVCQFCWTNLCLWIHGNGMPQIQFPARPPLLGWYVLVHWQYPSRNIEIQTRSMSGGRNRGVEITFRVT